MTLFFRVLDTPLDDKAHALRAAIAGEAHAVPVFSTKASSFKDVPGSPFAYWLNNRLRNLYSSLPAFEVQNERAVRLGASTKYDARFVRLWFEFEFIDETNWSTYANGGRFGIFFQDYYTIVRSCRRFRELGTYLTQKFPYLNGDPGWILHLENDYSQPAIGWPLRTHAFSPHALPEDTVFSARTYAAYAPRSALPSILALLASLPVDFFLKVMLGRSEHPEFVTGVVRALPWPTSKLPIELGNLFKRGWSIARRRIHSDEASRSFILPRAVLDRRISPVETEIASIKTEIDEIAFGLYQLEGEDRTLIETWDGSNTNNNDIAIEPKASRELDDSTDDEDVAESTASDIEALLSWSVGVAFGRFDVRLATGGRPLPTEPEPFDRLPVCSPAMLTGDDGRPLTKPLAGYPIAFPENGMLVDDPGHARDVTAAVRVVFDEVFRADADAWWNEVGALLDPKGHEVRAWLASSFFEYHLKRYSKSRRKAPIVWQLSVRSGRYSVWLYAHRLTRDSFFQIQNDVVTPKLVHEERQHTSLIQGAGANPSAKERKEIAEQEAFVGELRSFLDEIKRVAPLWNPMLDDGVVLTMAPLWRLALQHKPWQKELKSKWDELAAGKYDWAHVAMHLWPERIVLKCATDRSLAIAHGLEDVFWAESDDGKWKPRPNPTRQVDELVRERTSIAVKAALRSLLEAPIASANGGRGRGRRAANAASDGGAG